MLKAPGASQPPESVCARRCCRRTATRGPGLAAAAGSAPRPRNGGPMESNRPRGWRPALTGRDLSPRATTSREPVGLRVVPIGACGGGRKRPRALAMGCRRPVRLAVACGSRDVEGWVSDQAGIGALRRRLIRGSTRCTCTHEHDGGT